jgi:rSAM/selenodomain-associated transferase 2
MPRTISVVIPTLNEAASLKEVLERVRRLPEVCEIIISDGGSRDETREIASEAGCKVLRGAAGRGGQMRRGAIEAKGDVVLLLHADTWLPPEAGRAVFNCLRDASVSGGGFWKVFRERNPLLLGSRFKCAIRLYIGRRLMGDQAMFARREVLEEIGGVPDMPLMEEFELCRRLRKVGRLALADATVTTSARRFAKLGVARTYLRMWRVTLSYWLGMKPQELRRIYEKE